MLAITLIFSSVLTACKEEELSPEDKKEREVVLEELQEERNKIPEHVMVKEKYLDENDEIKGVVKYDYNDRGNITEANYYNDEGDLIERREYKYNDDGLLVERKITDLEGTWRDYLWRNGSKARIDFDNKWGVQEEILFELQEGLTATYEYNDNQQLVTYESRDDEGEKLRIIEIEYHPNYHKKSQKEKRFGGHILEHHYDESGNLIKRLEDTGYNISKHKYFRNEHGNSEKVERTRKDSNGEVIDKRISIYDYDEDIGKIVSHKITSKDKDYYRKIRFEYDENGNTIERKETDGKGNIEKKYRYDYDKNNNRVSSLIKDDTGEIVQNRNYKHEVDEGGNILKTVKYDLLTDRKAKDLYEYDDYKNLIRIREKHIKGNIGKNIKYEYEKNN